jgi:succinate dehydrogenase hydrophobic anchor subunit
MEGVLPLLILAAVLVAWQWLVPASSRRRSPLWGAFTATALAILFLTAGTAGYELSHGVPFTSSGAWTGNVIWSQIWMGAAIALVAAHLWRLGLQSIRRSLHEPAEAVHRSPSRRPE